MKRRFTKPALSIVTVVAVLVMAASLLGTGVEARKGSVRSDEKHKVHVTGKVMGDLGATDEDVANAFEESIDADKLGVEFVSETGDDVEEITIVMQVNDADDDNDGTPDAEDKDVDGDGVTDNQEVIGTVNLDQKDPELLNELQDTRKNQGLNILVEANDAKHHILKFETVADPPAEGDTASLNHALKGLAAHALPVPKWLKRTFTVVSYTARFASCATGSIGTCIGLIAEGYGGKR